MTDEWNSPEVNKKGVMKAYVDDYDNHAFGILQEDSQNGFDAYPKGTRINDMKIEFKYDADQKVLYYRDFKTTGMTHCTECEWGKRPDGTPCVNEECSWGCYHNLAYSGKSGFSLGSRGMGKSLRIESGESTVVNTTLPDGRFTASRWEVVDGDWKWKKSHEDMKKLSTSGTELISYSVKDEVHDQLIQFDKVVQHLQEKWFRLIDQGAKVEYILVKGSQKHRVIVPKLKYPPVETPDEEKPTTLKKNCIIIKCKGKRVGELRNLELFLAKETFDDEDHRHGIAIVKNGKQTITRYKQFPTDIPENIRRRIFGHVNANCETEPFLNEAENATHTGYQWTHDRYKAVRTELNKIVREFAQPFIKSGGERVTQKEQREAQEILILINSALSQIPELQIFGLSGGGPSGNVEINPKDYPYISRIEPINQRYNWGDKIHVKAVLKNPLEKELMVNVDFNFFDPTPIVIRDGSSWTLLRKGSGDKPFSTEVNWTIDVDDSMVPGVHWLQADLKDKDNNPLLDDKGKHQKTRSSIHIEQDPPIIQRRPRTGTGPKKGSSGGKSGDVGEGGLAGLQWFKKPDLPDHEVIIETARALAFVNRFGRRYKYLMERSKTKKTPWLAVGEAIAEKLIEKKIELDIEEGQEQWAAEQVKEKLKDITDVKLKFMKAFMKEIQ